MKPQKPLRPCWSARALFLVVVFAACQAATPENDDENDGTSGAAGSPPAGGAAGTASDGKGAGGGQAEAQGGAGGEDIVETAGGAGGQAGEPAPQAGNMAGTGGMANSGGGGGGGMSGAPTAACPALLCEDFEAGALDGDKWRASATGFKVDGGKPAHGKFSAHLTISKTTTGTSIKTKQKFSHTGPLYGRMNVFLTPHHNFGRAYYFRVGNNPNAEFGGKDGKFYAAPAGTKVDNQSAVPSNKWVCLQWQVKPSPLAMKIMVDGQEVATASAAGVDALPGLDPLELGFKGFATLGTDAEFYMDDIVIDAKPLACLP